MLGQIDREQSSRLRKVKMLSARSWHRGYVLNQVREATMNEQNGSFRGFGREVFSAEHETFRTTVRRFFAKEIEPNVRQWQQVGFYPAELFRKAGNAGLLCAGIPSEYGGGGGDVLHHLILHEEHGYSTAGASLEAGLCTDLTAYVLLNGGTEEQKREWLPRFATGEAIAEVGLSEPSAGSDPRGIKTFARRDGGDYVISGSKMWMSNGPIMSVLFLVAKTQSRDGGKESTSMFIVPIKGTKGITVSKPTELMLKSCGGVAEIFFDNVRIPAANLLGGVEGRGLTSALGAITLGRMATAVRCVAACELALQLTTEYTKNRQAFGQRVFDFQNTQFKLASMKTEIAVARAFVDDYLRRIAAGTLDQVQSAMAKLWTSELEGRVMDECLQLHGGVGFSDEFPISKMYAFARVHRIYVGTSEIMRTIISRSM
jgi:acyl-CoA dehydrogenase